MLLVAPAAGGVELLVYVGTGRARAAAHATLELDSSSGREPRTVNLRHFVGILSSAVGLRGAVLVGRQGGVFGGFAQAVVEQGVPAAMVWELSELSAGAAMPKAFLQRWREGASWSELARDAHAVEVAGEGPKAPSRPQEALINSAVREERVFGLRRPFALAGALQQAQLSVNERYPEPLYWRALICLRDPGPPDTSSSQAGIGSSSR